MIEGKSSLSLPLEATEGVRIACNLIGQEFQGYKPTQSSVLSLVHNTHPATAEFLADAVVGR